MKIIDQLKTEDGRVLDTQKEIMKEQVRFFKNLYEKHSEFNETNATEFIHGLDIQSLSSDQKSDLKTHIIKEDLTSALQLSNNDSAPGMDVFIKVFCQRLGLLFTPRL